MAIFPGYIFDGKGRPLDNRAFDLTPDEMEASTYRVAVQARSDALSRDGLSPVALIWLLTDDATFTAIPPAIVAVTTETVLTGQSVLILARRSEVGAEIRDGLLEALEPARAFDDLALRN